MLGRRHFFQGVEISVNRALEKLVNLSSHKASACAKKIFVGGVPNKATEAELFGLFERYGIVQNVTLPRKSKDENKGYAFVAFEDFASVERVFADLKNVILRAKVVG